ncbi:MAG: carbohydrate-binding protein [Chloroflexi bacterium]|nr:carbohydrate-binding protein [Chloroflexota bacterium]
MTRSATFRRSGLGLIAAGCLTVSCLIPAQRTHAGSRVAPAFPFEVRGLTQVAQLIGPTPGSPNAGTAASPHSITDTTRWGVCGGDLGSLMVAQGTAYIALGDNYTSCPPGTGGPGPGLVPPDWRSNALGIITNPRDFTHGLRITKWYSSDGRHAAEAIPSQHDAGSCQDSATPGCEVTAIPTYGFTTQNRLFLAYMSVHHWGPAAVWDVNYSSLAMSSDRGKTWHIERGKVQWGPKSNFAQVAVAPDPDGTHLLFYGIPAGRFGAVKLMRVANNWQSVLSQSSYQYFIGTDANGRPRWSTKPAQAAVVAGAPVGELSVIYDAGLKRWLMTYLQGGNDQIMPSSGDLVIRSAANYWGPWSTPATLVSHTQFPGLYGAFMNDHFVADSGRTIYFVMSQWDPYSIFWMRATLAPAGVAK